MKWYEIITTGSRRPNFPEDNTIYVEAKDMVEALNFLKDFVGELTVPSDVYSCRVVGNVFSSAKIDKLKNRK